MRTALYILVVLLVFEAATNISTPVNGPQSTIQKIQTAIDSASVNSTILVSGGTYYENLVVYKPLRLIGASSSDTIIDGGGLGTVIKVNSSNVEISGFTIRNALSYSQGIYLSGVSHVNITSNIINAASDGDGVSLDGSNNNTITGNTFSGNLYAVNATNSKYNLVARNIGASNTVGVQLWNALYNVVANNSFNHGETGLYMYKGTGNLLVRNIAVKNSEIGVDIVNSTGNTIIENSLEINRFGIDMQFSQGNTFYHNNVVSNTLYQVNFVNQQDRAFTVWDNGTASCSSCVKGGNYWDDYKGTDNNRDGIGDTGLPADGVDNYPLMSPYTPLALAARVLYSALNGTAPLTVQLSARVVGGTAPYAYHWDFGDGTTALSANATHTYHSTGSYTAKLAVSDSAGASDQDVVTISVRATPSNLILIAGSAGGAAAAVAIVTAVFWKRRRSTLPPSPS